MSVRGRLRPLAVLLAGLRRAVPRRAVPRQVVPRQAVPRRVAVTTALAVVTLLAVSGCAASASGTGPSTGSSGSGSGSATAPAARHASVRPAPAGDAFYRPPTPLPAGQPGDVLWSRRVDPPGRLRQLGVSTVQVLYLSTDALGRPTAVSGTVMLPHVDRATAPIVGFAVGTQGLGDQCAPSRAIAAGTEYEMSGIAEALGRGWAVAATDYEGLGTPGEHTYVVGRAEGPAVIDAVRAAIRLLGSGLSPSARVAYTGYSQGGGSAAWAGELSAKYAPELHLVGVAAGGVPADPAALRASLDGTVYAGLALGAALGFDAAYPDLHLADHLTPTGRAQLVALGNACAAAMLSPLYQHVRIATYLTSDPLGGPAWKARFAQNTLGADPPRVPVLLYHGEADTTVAFGQAERLARTYCARGAEVTWIAYPGQNHAGAAAAGRPSLFAFLAARFAGAPASRSCPA